MASINRRTDRPNQPWQARWREYPGGPQKTRSFDRKADATRFLATVEADLIRGTYIEPGAGTVTLADYAEAWRTIQTHRPLTVVNVEGTIRNHVVPGLGHLPLSAIRTSHIQAWVKERSLVLAPSTMVVAARILSSILRSAVRDRLISVSPMDGVKVPRAPRRQATPLTAENLEQLLEAVPGRYRALIVAGAGLGMREGELLGLTVGHVRFLERIVEVRQQLVLVPGHTPVLALPKTAAGVRDIPLPDVVGSVLSEHPSRYGAGDDDLVFTAEGGRPIRRNRLSDLWRSWTGFRRPRGQAGVPRPPPHLRLPPDPPRRGREDGVLTDGARRCERDAADLRPSLAEERGPDPPGHRQPAPRRPGSKR